MQEPLLSLFYMGKVDKMKEKYIIQRLRRYLHG